MSELRRCQYNTDFGIEGVGLDPIPCGRPVPCPYHMWSVTSDPRVYPKGREAEAEQIERRQHIDYLRTKAADFRLQAKYAIRRAFDTIATNLRRGGSQPTEGSPLERAINNGRGEVVFDLKRHGGGIHSHEFRVKRIVLAEFDEHMTADEISAAEDRAVCAQRSHNHHVDDEVQP